MIQDIFCLGASYWHCRIGCGRPGTLYVNTFVPGSRAAVMIQDMFLVSGLAHLAFNKRSFSDFLWHMLEYCVEWSTHFMYINELFLSGLRLAGYMRITKRFAGKRINEFSRTHLVMHHFQLLKHEGTVLHISGHSPRRVEENSGEREEIQGIFDSSYFENWPLGGRRKNLWYKAAAVDQHLSTCVSEFVTDEVVWKEMVPLVQNFIPQIQEFSIPARQAFVHLVAYYATSTEVSIAFDLANAFLKADMQVYEIMALDACHGLLALAWCVLRTWKAMRAEGRVSSKVKKEIEEIQGAISQNHSFMQTFFPHVGLFSLQTITNELRLYGLCRTIAIDFYTALRAILTWLVRWVRKNVMGVKDEFDAFITEVDQIHDVCVFENGGSTTFKRSMVSDRSLRNKMAHLLTLGTQLQRKIEVSRGPKELLAAVKDRLTKVRKMVAGSQSTYVGAEGKIKPFTVYFHGPPGVGKSVMLPHLCKDLGYVMGDGPFAKARDL